MTFRRDILFILSSNHKSIVIKEKSLLMKYLLLGTERKRERFRRTHRSDSVLMNPLCQDVVNTCDQLWLGFAIHSHVFFHAFSFVSLNT